MRKRFLLVATAALAMTAASAALRAGEPENELRLSVPTSLEGVTRLSAPFDGEPRELVLEPRSYRAAGFRVRGWSAQLGLRAVEVPAPGTVVGRIEGDPESRVAGGLGPDGWTLRVVSGDGRSWWVRPEPGARGVHRVTPGDPGFPVGRDCGVEAMLPVTGGDAPSGAPEADPFATRLSRDRLARPAAPQRFWCGPSGMKLAQIAYDVDFPYYQNLGSDLPAVIANVENHTAVVDNFYARDALITYEITEIIVRESRFYIPDANNNLLILFRDEWNANHTDVIRDMAHLMTGQPAPGLAGLAYVSVTCNLAWAYGWSVDSSGVVGHELGHNWSAGHCHDTSPCNNMCGACLYIGPNTKDIIMGFRDSRTCLDDAPDYADPVPPYAHPDTVLIERDQAIARSAVVIDALANDHDANCDDLIIASNDDRSRHRGPVQRSAGSGPSDRDELIYTPPCRLFSDPDTLEYTIEDATGEQSSAAVTVHLRHPDLVAYWPMDDGADVTATDVTARAGHGTLMGGASWGSGVRDGALVLDGVDGSVSAPGPGIEGSEMTIAGWIRRDGAQAPWAGIVFSRDAGTLAGLNFGEADELRYHWNGDGATWGWDSGLVVPDQQWVFLALVVSPSEAVMYLNDGGGFQSATNVFSHARQTWAGELRIGEDPTGGRYFRGELDDVRLYNWALSPSEIDTLFLQGGGAVAPHPANGRFLADPGAPLTWTPSALADSHDVYFGNDFLAVRDATPGSEAFQGSTPAASWQLADLPAQDQVYYWRVDTHVGAATLPGDVWMFTVRSPDPRLEAYFRFEDAPGPVATDATRRGRDGTLTGGVTWAAGPYGGALEFDGVDGAVTIPPLNIEGSSATIAAWIRRDGGQVPWAGIVMSRENGTGAALNFGEADELRYHWNNASNTWGWDSGLVVPDGLWVFAALVVEPSQATIYLWDGTLQSAVNTVGHAAQTFAGTTYIGRDPGFTTRDFRGALDDVRIYDYALTTTEIEALIALGGPAEAPSPPDGVQLGSPPVELAWAPGRDADSHDVYFGRGYAAVAAATTSDPEFLGNQVSAVRAVSGMRSGETWYWRVDERVGGQLVPGTVWRFSIAEDLGSSLRVGKSALGEPVLRWRELGNSKLYEIQRCEAPLSGGCTPATVTAVGPYRSEYTDWTVPASRLLWYRVAVLDPCAP